MSDNVDPYEGILQPSHVDLLVPRVRAMLEAFPDVEVCLAGGVHRVPNPLVVPEAAIPFLTVFAQTEQSDKQINSEFEVKLELVVGVFTSDDRVTIEDDERTVASLTNAIRSALASNELLEFVVGGSPTCFAEGIDTVATIPYGQFTSTEDQVGEYHVVIATYRYKIDAKTGVIQ